MYCNKCGTACEEDSKFCNKCGNKLSREYKSDINLISSNVAQVKTELKNELKSSILNKLFIFINIVAIFYSLYGIIGLNVAIGMIAQGLEYSFYYGLLWTIIISGILIAWYGKVIYKFTCISYMLLDCILIIQYFRILIIEGQPMLRGFEMLNLGSKRYLFPIAAISILSILLIYRRRSIVIKHNKKVINNLRVDNNNVERIIQDNTNSSDGSKAKEPIKLKEPIKTFNGEIMVTCPWCMAARYIEGEGKFVCRRCKKTLIYENSTVIKQDDYNNYNTNIPSDEFDIEV